MCVSLKLNCRHTSRGGAFCVSAVQSEKNLDDFFQFLINFILKKFFATFLALFFFFLPTCNSYNIKLALLMQAIPWHVIYSQNCATFALSPHSSPSLLSPRQTLICFLPLMIYWSCTLRISEIMGQVTFPLWLLSLSLFQRFLHGVACVTNSCNSFSNENNFILKQIILNTLQEFVY